MADMARKPVFGAWLEGARRGAVLAPRQAKKPPLALGTSTRHPLRTQPPGQPPRVRVQPQIYLPQSQHRFRHASRLGDCGRSREIHQRTLGGCPRVHMVLAASKRKTAPLPSTHRVSHAVGAGEGGFPHLACNFVQSRHFGRVGLSDRHSSPGYFRKTIDIAYESSWNGLSYGISLAV
jgi:hypothetical protein